MQKELNLFTILVMNDIPLHTSAFDFTAQFQKETKVGSRIFKDKIQIYFPFQYFQFTRQMPFNTESIALIDRSLRTLFF